jgi:hypothetical protein
MLRVFNKRIKKLAPLRKFSIGNHMNATAVESEVFANVMTDHDCDDNSYDNDENDFIEDVNDDEDNNDSDYVDTENNLSEIKSYFEAAGGFIDYLKSDFGGEKKKGSVGTVITRACKFIEWESNQLGHSGSINVSQLLYNVIKYRYTSISGYKKNLSEIKHMNSSTITNTLRDLSRLFEWYTTFRQDRDVNFITDASE